MSYHDNINNLVPEMWHGPFESGDPIPYQVVPHEDEEEDTIECSIPYNQLPLEVELKQ